MGTVATHRMLRPSCDCDACSAKRSDWADPRNRIGAKPRTRRRPSTSRLSCPSCGNPMNRSGVQHAKCSRCRKADSKARRLSRPTAATAMCAGSCGKRMTLVKNSAKQPMCRECRRLRLVPSLNGVQRELRTHCPQGHEYTEANTRIQGHARRCRTCERDYQAQYAADGRRPKTRGHRSWRKLRDEYRTECATQKLRCWICNERIDYTLRWPDNMAFEADHIFGVKAHPELALDRSNLAPSHSTCNRKRGATPVDPVDQRVEEFLLAQLRAAREEIAELRALRGE